MWSIEKVGAVGSPRQADALCLLSRQNLAPQIVSDERSTLSDFGEGSPSFRTPVSTNSAGLNRQIAVNRMRSKSQKINTCDLLKSPKNHILQHHELRAWGMNVGTRIAGHGSRLTVNGSRPLATSHSLLAAAFLTGSGSQTEIAVTYSEQRTGQILTCFRIVCKRSSNQSKFSPEFVRGARVALHGWRLT